MVPNEWEQAWQSEVSGADKRMSQAFWRAVFCIILAGKHLMKAVDRPVSAFKKWSWPAKCRLIHGQSTGDSLTKKEMGGSILFADIFRPSWSRIKKGAFFCFGNCHLERFFNFQGFRFGNQLMFLAGSTSSKYSCLVVPHLTHNLILFPLYALYTKNMHWEAMKTSCVKRKIYELQISSFFQAPQMDQFWTFLPTMDHAFTL